ncbi:MAG: DUF2089 domain-containing protein [Clostridia bacterium]
MKYKVPGRCPVCSKELTINHISCSSCQTKISGEFYVTNFSLLDERQMKFVEAFLKCRGNIREVEKELGISYPTVKSRLDEIADVLGLDMGPDNDSRRRNILEGIEKGEISVDEAVRMFKNQKEGN